MSDKTLTRISALLRKAESTDNEHEADAFLSAAQRLATAASVDLAVARAHGGASQARIVPTQREVEIGQAGKRGLRTYVELFLAIAHANDVRCDVARNSTRVFAYGFPPDLDAVHALYASLIVQMVTASDEFIKSGRYRTARGVSPITARLSFQRAFAARIGRRLAEAGAQARHQAEAERGAEDARRTSSATAGAGHSRLHGGRGRGRAGSSSVALALRTKELELAEHYRATSTARGTWKGSSASAGYSERAARAGDRAGRSARLGTEKELGTARRRLPR